MNWKQGAIQERDALYESIRPILEKIDALEKVISLFPAENDKPPVHIPQSIESPEITFKEKVYNILTTTIGKPVKANQMYVHIYGKSELTKDEKNNLSSTLNNLKKDKLITNYKIDNNNNLVYWGHPSWFNEDGKPKDM